VPPATQRIPFQAIAYTFLRIAPIPVKPSQFTPSLLVASVFVPWPAAINWASAALQVTPNPVVAKTVVVVIPDHVVPSGLVAMEFVPVPTATQRESEEAHATARPVVVMPEDPRAVHVMPSVLEAKTFVPVPTAT
jgi:hypothetical protein